MGPTSTRSRLLALPSRVLFVHVLVLVLVLGLGLARGTKAQAHSVRCPVAEVLAPAAWALSTLSSHPKGVTLR